MTSRLGTSISGCLGRLKSFSAYSTPSRKRNLGRARGAGTAGRRGGRHVAGGSRGANSGQRTALPVLLQWVGAGGGVPEARHPPSHPAPRWRAHLYTSRRFFLEISILSGFPLQLLKGYRTRTIKVVLDSRPAQQRRGAGGRRLPHRPSAAATTDRRYCRAPTRHPRRNSCETLRSTRRRPLERRADVHQAAVKNRPPTRLLAQRPSQEYSREAEAGCAAPDEQRCSLGLAELSLPMWPPTRIGHMSTH